MIGENTTDRETQRLKTDDADSYNAVVDYFDQYSQRFTAHLCAPLLAMLNTPANGTVLDVGTGTGVMSLAMADNIGSRGKVVGIDLSEGMLGMARNKAGLKGLQLRTAFLKMDAEKLVFPGGCFDAVLSLYALRHFPDPGKALSEMYRVLKPGASVAVAVGSSPTLLSADGCKAAVRRLGSIWRQSTGRELSACEFVDSLVEKYLPQSPDREVDKRAELLHGSWGSLEDMVNAAGFTNIRKGWKGQYSSVESADDFWLLQITFSSTARKRIQQADTDMLERLRAEFFRRCDQVLKKQGRLIYQTGAAIIVGDKPARQADA